MHNKRYHSIAEVREEDQTERLGQPEYQTRKPYKYRVDLFDISSSI